MKRSLISMAALALFFTATCALAVGVIPPASKWSSSLTEPTPASLSDFHITKSSSASVAVTTGNVSFQVKLAGVTDGVGGPLVNQVGNTFQVDVRYGPAGTLHTEQFPFDLVGGKTIVNATKFVVSNGLLGGPGVVPDDSIQVVAVRCIQSGGGAGAGNSFCTAGLTAK